MFRGFVVFFSLFFGVYLGDGAKFPISYKVSETLVASIFNALC